MKKLMLRKMKRLLLLLVLLASITWMSGCSAGSALAVRSLSADRLTPSGELFLIQKIKVAHETWHIEEE